MKIQEITKNQVIHCDTEEKAIKLCKKLHELGYKWANGKKYIDNVYWDCHREQMCYNIHEGYHGNKNIYIKYDITIIPFDNLDLEDFPEKWYLSLKGLSDNIIKELNEWRFSQPNCSHKKSLLKNHTLLSKHKYDNSYYYSNNPTILKEEPFYNDYVEITYEQFKKQFKTMENFKLQTVDARKIIDIACQTWKDNLIALWSKELLLNDYVEITESFYNEMIKASDSKQKNVINSIMGEYFKSRKIDLTDNSTFDNLDIFLPNGNADTSLISIIGFGSTNKLYLNTNYNWKIEDYKLICTRK